ncbi:MAG: Trk system potassium transporter TrkA [Clostridia bacterium]|nr:Trk system potassium transporter TrkA [Clostridia bacterium]MBQ4354267.1 Trk system potassium transporter TrkA [Clostridia bacterium]
MKIVVNGCGKIGSTILANLAAEGHDVIALDSDPAVVSEMTNIYDVMGVCGNGADCETLETAGVENAELFIAATGSDELNMLSCFLAGRMGAAHNIARIRNPEYNDESLGFMKRELGLSMAINPELLAAKDLYNILNMPSVAKVETFSGRSFEMVELRLKENSVLDGISLAELRNRYKTRVLICIVQRSEEVYIPGGDFVLKSGDKIALTASPNEIQKFLRQIGLVQKKIKNVMILGGSKTAYYLAKMLESNASVKIIEKNVKTAEELTETLPDSVIIHGDGAQQELLNEEGIRSTDAFLTLTGMDEQNILLAIYAMSQNVPKVIAKTNRPELSAMAEKLGLDCIVSPRQIIADVLVQYARALENSRGSHVETLYKLMDGQVEALEFHVRQAVPELTGVPLRELSRKPGILIAGITRGRRSIVPGGEDCIMPGDRVVVLAANQRLADLADIVK